MPTIYASFSDPASAEQAAGALLDQGASAEMISILVGEASGYARSYSVERDAEKGITTTTPADAGVGAIKGAIAGAGIGTLAALAAMFIPGVGLVLGGGALAAAFAGGAGTVAAGAAAGGVVGYLKDQGVTTDLASTYSSDLQRGGAILAVTTPTGPLSSEDTEALLVKYGAGNVSTLNQAHSINPENAPPDAVSVPSVREPSAMTLTAPPQVVDEVVTPDVWADPLATDTVVTGRTAVVDDVVDTANVPPAVVPVAPLVGTTELEPPSLAADPPLRGDYVVERPVPVEDVVIETPPPGASILEEETVVNPVVPVERRVPVENTIVETPPTYSDVVEEDVVTEPIVTRKPGPYADTPGADPLE